MFEMTVSPLPHFFPAACLGLLAVSSGLSETPPLCCILLRKTSWRCRLGKGMLACQQVQQQAISVGRARETQGRSTCVFSLFFFLSPSLSVSPLFFLSVSLSSPFLLSPSLSFYLSPFLSPLLPVMRSHKGLTPSSRDYGRTFTGQPDETCDGTNVIQPTAGALSHSR